MKVLILSCNTGEGHNSAGRALIEALERRGAQGVMIDALSFAPKGLSRLVSEVHAGVYRKVPELFNAGYDLGERVSAPNNASIAYRASALYAKKLYRYILEGGFDAVVCPHVFPAEALTWLRRHEGSALLNDIPCYFIATDYTCSPFVDETALDGYCIPHASLAEEFAGKGIPREKLLSTGIPVAARYSTRIPRAEAREALSLPAGGRVLLLMTGSMGAGRTEEIAAAIVPQLTVRDRLLCLCGNNEKLRQALLSDHRVDPRVVIMGYTDRVSLLMDAADLLLTKAGGLTSTEAAVKGIPLLLTESVAGCEAHNVTFFTAQGIAIAAHEPQDIARKALSLLADPAACAAMTSRQRETLPSDAAGRIADMLLLEAGEDEEDFRIWAD